MGVTCVLNTWLRRHIRRLLILLPDGLVPDPIPLISSAAGQRTLHLNLQLEDRNRLPHVVSRGVDLSWHELQVTEDGERQEQQRERLVRSEVAHALGALVVEAALTFTRPWR